MIEKYLRSQVDWFLIAITFLLAFCGILAIYSATHAQALPFYQRQLYWLTIGAVAIIPIIMMNYTTFERFAYVIYLVVIVMLALALIVGKTTSGAQRWLSLGFISFQPSEIAKIAFILALAKHLSGKNIPNKGLDFKDLVIPALIFIAPFLLIVKQPDLGTALIFLFVFISMLLVAKVRLRALITLSIAFVSILPLAWGHLKDYQKARVLSFLDPASDPLGRGYHLLQSKIAVGSGGFLGKGFTKSTQASLQFLPEHHTDFIFSVVAEEWGFIGGSAIIGVFLILILRGLDIANNSKDRFGFLLAFGITALIFWHIVINIAMVLGLLPVVGVPLPFISYGGSFLITMFAATALLLNVRMRRFSF